MYNTTVALKLGESGQEEEQGDTKPEPDQQKGGYHVLKCYTNLSWPRSCQI